MQSDDLFIRKFRRQNVRPPVASVNYDAKGERGVVEWPPRRESEGADPGDSLTPSRAGLTLRSAGRGGHIMQRSNSDVTLGDLDSSGKAGGKAGVRAGGEKAGAGAQGDTGPPLHREYGSLSSLERRTHGAVGAALRGTRAPESQRPALQGPLPAARPPGQPARTGRVLPRPVRLGDGRLPQARQAPETRGPRQEVQARPAPDPPARALRQPGGRSLGQELRPLRRPEHPAGPDGGRHQPRQHRPQEEHHLGRVGRLPAAAALPGVHVVVAVAGRRRREQRRQRRRQHRQRRPRTVAAAGRGGRQRQRAAPQLPALPQRDGRGGAGGTGPVPGAVPAGPTGGPWLSSRSPNDAVSVLEEPRESHVQQQGKSNYFIEHADLGAHYYRKYFYMKGTMQCNAYPINLFTRVCHGLRREVNPNAEFRLRVGAKRKLLLDEKAQRWPPGTWILGKSLMGSFCGLVSSSFT